MKQFLLIFFLIFITGCIPGPLKELKYQLRETEKFFNWYNKIKTMNELDSNQYWKRTNKHIYKIKERLINIAKTIQEIEK